MAADWFESRTQDPAAQHPNPVAEFDGQPIAVE
jgi:hypothetical protein